MFQLGFLEILLGSFPVIARNRGMGSEATGSRQGMGSLPARSGEMIMSMMSRMC